jgi:hypothetical protein
MEQVTVTSLPYIGKPSLKTIVTSLTKRSSIVHVETDGSVATVVLLSHKAGVL